MDLEKIQEPIKISDKERELLKKRRKIPKRRRLESDRPKITYGICPDYISRDPTIPVEIRHLFTILHSFAIPKDLEKTPRACEKMETYAKCLGVHRRTVGRYLRDMHREGYLTMRRRYAGKPNMILLHAERKRR